MGLAVVGFELGGAAKAFQRGLAGTLLEAHVAQIVVRFGVIGANRDGPADQFGAFSVIAHLRVQHAREVQRLGVLRLGGEKLTVDPSRLYQPARLVMAQRLAQRARRVARNLFLGLALHILPPPPLGSVH